MTNTEKRLEEFDIAFPEGGTSGWIGDPRYPADLCCGADYCSPNCDKRKREAIKAFLTEKLDQAIAEERKRVVGEIDEVLDIAKGNLYPFQDEKERLEIVIEKLTSLDSLDKPLTDN